MNVGKELAEWKDILGVCREIRNGKEYSNQNTLHNVDTKNKFKK